MASWRVRLLRLYQPRHPAFWLVIALNLLSTVLAWIARSYELGALPALAITGVAVLNALISLRLMVGLMRDEPPPGGDPSGQQKPFG